MGGKSPPWEGVNENFLAHSTEAKSLRATISNICAKKTENVPKFVLSNKLSEEVEPIYAYKRYAYKKTCIGLNL